MAIGELGELVPVDHPRFRLVETAIFVRRVVADCMSYTCREREPTRILLDACCQYGADTDIGERDAILAREADIRPLLRADAAGAPWFTPPEDEEDDPDFPSGRRTRTARWNDGCVFLAHDRRGCAIHRASIEHGWDFRGVKPAICRLFPLTYDHDSIGLSDDYTDYSCAFEPNAPSVYRVSRDALGDLFGADLIEALDAVEARVLATEPRRLPQVS